ncbi:extracellular conserved serine-rich protein [Colletotrichum plurivorum]|uniref:Extracellular conserved serine-rich protein n=1 Tax=Colletotrichum plurivorum TaxID=2175906 RepID=A0A8H6K2D6_9PEZI|nr:extracellular conserved serine-rich protein [Colletotrichum plurivorum]
MYAKTAIAITSLLAAAEAVKVTKPAKGDEWDLSKTNEITWDSVNTDPSSFEIVIVNQSSYPPVEVKIGKVNTADGKYELKDAKVSAGDNYRINFVSTDPQNSGILAQSEQFDLTVSDDDDKTTSASATASATGASTSGSASASASATGASTSGTATVTATASGLTTVTTGTATASASGTASDASGSASGTATGSAASGTSTTAPSSASAIKSTFAIFGSVAVAAYMLF